MIDIKFTVYSLQFTALNRAIVAILSTIHYPLFTSSQSENLS